MSEPNKTEKAVVAVSGKQPTDSVLDFLYYDSRRINSFLAQFDPSGHLLQVRQSDSTGGVSTNESSKAMGLTHGLKVDRASASKSTEEEHNTFERTYDPLWGNARAFLDYLSERELIKRDLGSAKVGQIVLASGELSIADTQILGKLMTLPSLRNAMNISSPKKPGVPVSVGGGDSMVEIFTVLPHSLQARMKSAMRLIWGCLREDSFVGLPSDILLKYGASVAGTWSMLGILDAPPDQGATVVPNTDIPSKIATEGLVSALTAIGPFARMALGRPNGAFGVTPLLIFREVGS
jgi:hypothetical protein